MTRRATRPARSLPYVSLIPPPYLPRISRYNQARHAACQKPHKYKKLVYSLCWFHSVLVLA